MTNATIALMIALVPFGLACLVGIFRTPRHREPEGPPGGGGCPHCAEGWRGEVLRIYDGPGGGDRPGPAAKADGATNGEER